MKKNKFLLGIGVFGLALAPSIFLSGCFQSSEVQPAVQWLSGTESPTDVGNEGDFYIDTDDNLLYKKTDGVWQVIMNNFGSNSNVDENVPTIEINDNGFWEINGEDSGIKAKGEDGKSVTVESFVKTSENETETIYTLTFSDGSSYPISVKHGKDGVATEISINDNGYWVVDGVEKGVAIIKIVSCDLVSSNDNVDKYEIKFNNGDKASFNVKNGEDGATPTVEINEKGTWVINGEETDWSTIISHEDLADALDGVIEIDNSKFNATYEAITSPYDFANNNIWAYTNRDMYGYKGVIGNPSEISSLRFKVRKALSATSDIAKISVELQAVYPLADGATESVIKTVATDELIVNYTDVLDNGASVYNSHDVVWNLDEKIINTDNCYYVFSYVCTNTDNQKVKVDMFGLVGDYPQIKLSDETLAKYTGMNLCYFSNRWYTVTGNPVYLVPVQVGESVPKFKLATKIEEDFLNKINVTASLYTNNKIMLPDTIYGCVGQTMEIYLNNISAYSTEEVKFNISSGKGVLYTDKWQYTPTEPESFNLTINMYSNDYKYIGGKTVSVVISSAETESQTTVLVIGDSTVAGGNEVSKMIELANVDSSKELTFIGTKGTGDVRHEGRSGWTIRTYMGPGAQDNPNPFYNTESQSIDFANYMTVNSYTDLDVVFIQLGINDMFSVNLVDIENKVKEFNNYVQILINSIHAYDPNIEVIINPVFYGCPDQDKFGEHYKDYGVKTVWEYNYKIYNLNVGVYNKFNGVNNVYISYANAAIDSSKNVPQDVHPSIDGYNQLGAQMYYYLKGLLASL